MGGDRPASEISPSEDDLKRFQEQAQAAADYIAKNVKGRMVPSTKTIRNVNVSAEGERLPDKPEQREQDTSS